MDEIANQQKLQALRKEYQSREFEQGAADPFEQFEAWFSEAVQAFNTEPNAMALATVSADGHPD